MKTKYRQFFLSHPVRQLPYVSNVLYCLIDSPPYGSLFCATSKFPSEIQSLPTSLPASPTSPDILSGKSHIPSEMPGKSGIIPKSKHRVDARDLIAAADGALQASSLFSEYTDVRKSPSHP